MAKSKATAPEKFGIVYVMENLHDAQEVRVGHHTTSNEQREREVNFGKGESWIVVFSVTLESKITATAVEHVAHALLNKYVHKRESGDDSGHTRTVYPCSQVKARNAIKKAITNFAQDLKIKVLPLDAD